MNADQTHESEPLNAPLFQAAAAQTREAWLALAARQLAPLFTAAGLDTAPDLARLKLAAGWPLANSRKQAAQIIGQCWSPAASAAAKIEIFISPQLDRPVDVLAVLLHELIHAAIGNDKRHGPHFAAYGRRLGLQKPWPATTPTPELAARLARLAADLPPYPHARLAVPGKPQKPAAQRLLKLVCPDCGYTIHTSRKWLDLYGAPCCPCNPDEPREFDLPE